MFVTFFYFPHFTSRRNTATVKNHPSVDFYRILSKLQYLVSVWQQFLADNRTNFGENWKKWVSCTYQALFSAEITVTQTKYTLDKYHEYFNINFEGKRIVYWISQWLHKHKWHRTFWKLNWCRKQMKAPRIWCWPIGDESY